MKTTETRRQYRFYSACCIILAPIFYFLFGLRVTGREKIPDGAAIVCANHSSFIDPVVLVFAFTRKYHLHLMAKVELFKNRLLGFFLRHIGTFPVDRSSTDIHAIKTALQYLRNGEKIGMFPEGTRVSEDDAVTAKNGAVKMADKTGAPIVPVYIPRRKGIFRKLPVVIGDPFYVNPEKRKLTGEEFASITEELMEKIKELKPEELR